MLCREVEEREGGSEEGFLLESWGQGGGGRGARGSMTKPMVFLFVNSGPNESGPKIISKHMVFGMCGRFFKKKILPFFMFFNCFLCFSFCFPFCFFFVFLFIFFSFSFILEKYSKNLLRRFQEGGQMCTRIGGTAAKP